MRQHLPLAPTAVQVQKCIEHLSHLHLSGPPSVSITGAGIKGSRIAHCASVKSEGYALRLSCSSAIRAPASALSAFCLPHIIVAPTISFRRASKSVVESVGAGRIPSQMLAIPTTLQEALLARLDRLSTARPVAQLGATLGREFSHELLQAIAPLPE